MFSGTINPEQQVASEKTLSGLLSDLRQLDTNGVSFEKLGAVVRGFDPTSIEWERWLPPEPRPGTYSRNVLMMHPVECAILRWPPGTESAIHWHSGFYGFVIVLKGMANDTSFTYQNGELSIGRELVGLPYSVIPEEDGMIHRVSNHSDQDELLTLHIYYPPLETLGGMKIFDPPTGRIGTLSDEAKAASWSIPPEQFTDIRENAFTLSPENETHRMVELGKKPASPTIIRWVKEYYDEQARHYDAFDMDHPPRRAYLRTINRLVADDLKSLSPLNDMLFLACGTGRRATRIRELSERDFNITGVDLSPAMSAVASSRGVDVVASAWMDAQLDDRTFDAASLLYAIGHLPSSRQRLAALLKLNRHLKHGAPFYFDAFSVNDEYEWGPEVSRSHDSLDLQERGYERGDVFYRKTDGKAISFLHYFSESEIRDLLQAAGFEVGWIKYVGYAHHPGELVETPMKGSFVVKAVKVRDR